MEKAEAGEQVITGIAERLRNSARVEIAFGESRVVGDKTIIPIARVAYGFGGGGGAGKEGSEGGVGGGGGISVKPIAVLEIDAAGTRVLPIIDWGSIVRRGMLLMGLCMLSRVIRRR